MYGKGCMERCSCPQGTSCHHVSGECGCPPGFMGNGCEQSEQHLPPLLLSPFRQCSCEPSPSLPQLVFQVPLGRTVTRSASAPRQTNSAILCLDRVTAPQVFTAPDVTKVRKKTVYLYLLDISHYTEVNKSLFLNLGFIFSLWRGSLWSEL